MWDAVCYGNPLQYFNEYDCHPVPTMYNPPFDFYAYHRHSVSDDGRPGTSSDKSLVCTVCADSAEGFHFGAVACAACGAFFRRSVSDQKTYSCPQRKCNVRFDSAKRGGICRYCRFEKCLNVGMLPQEVQAKRARKAIEDRSSPYQKQGTPKRKVTGLIELLMQLRRDIISGRTRYYSKKEAAEPCNFDTMKRCMSTEFQLFQQIILASPLFKELITQNPNFWSEDDQKIKKETEMADCWTKIQSDLQRDLFLMFCVFEMCFTTAAHGGIQMDRCTMQNGTSMEITDAGLSQFFLTQLTFNDPECLARLSSPFFSQLVRVCSRALQGAHLDEVEAAFLFYIILSQLVPSQLRSSQYESTRAALFSEISAYYEGQSADVSFKMGNLLLIGSPMMQTLHDFKEFIAVIDLAHGTWMS